MKKKPSAEDRERSAAKDDPLHTCDHFEPIGNSRRARRRALLGAISAAGLTGAAPLPRHWARPVVDHVLLPAHAQTSPAGCAISCSVTLEFTTSTGLVSTTTTVEGTITDITSVPAVSLTSAGTFACVREPDGDSVSASSSASESATTTDTTFLTTFSDSSFSSSSSFSGGAECELDLSDVIEEETPAS